MIIRIDRSIPTIMVLPITIQRAIYTERNMDYLLLRILNAFWPADPLLEEIKIIDRDLEIL
jgi:hypothetical protein